MLMGLWVLVSLIIAVVYRSNLKAMLIVPKVCTSPPHKMFSFIKFSLTEIHFQMPFLIHLVPFYHFKPIFIFNDYVIIFEEYL